MLQAGRPGDGEGGRSPERRQVDGVKHEVAGLVPDEGGVHRPAVAQQQRGDRGEQRERDDEGRERLGGDARVEPRGPGVRVHVSGRGDPAHAPDGEQAQDGGGREEGDRGRDGRGGGEALGVGRPGGRKPPRAGPAFGEKSPAPNQVGPSGAVIGLSGEENEPVVKTCRTSVATTLTPVGS